MRQVLAILRCSGAIVILLLGTPLVLIGGLLPVGNRGIPVPMLVATYMARLFCVLFNVQIQGPNIERIRHHAGMIFPNHLSYLDSIVLVACGPVRYLSAAEVRDYPVVGWLARSLGTVFVERSDRNSRQQARSAVVEAHRKQQRPAIVIYPEGRLGIGTALFAFRHGAFEIAIKNGIPFLPCAIRYEPAHIALWRGLEGETLLPAVWRLAQYPGPVVTTLTPLGVVSPNADDDPATLAKSTQAQICQTLSIDAVISVEGADDIEGSLPAPAWHRPAVM